MENSKDNKELPRVEESEDEGFIILEQMSDVIVGLRSTVRLLGLFLTFAIVMLIGMTVVIKGLSSSVEELDSSVDHVDQVVVEARDASQQTSQDLRAALERSADPERAERLQRAFEVIFQIGDRLEEHIEQTGG